MNDAPVFYSGTDKPIVKSPWIKFKQKFLRPGIMALVAAVTAILLYHARSIPPQPRNLISSISFRRNRVVINFDKASIDRRLEYSLSYQPDSSLVLRMVPAEIRYAATRVFEGLDIDQICLKKAGPDTAVLQLQFAMLTDIPAVTKDTLRNRLVVHFNRALDSTFVVILDPGHGGSNIGATGITGLKEKAMNLDMALRLEKKLMNNKQIRVILTRRTDRELSLSARRSLSNQWEADLFLSLHGNSAPNSRVNLPEVYHSRHDHRQAAGIILETLKTVVRADTGFVRQRGYAVIRGNAARKGALLVETQYLSNPHGEKLLRQSSLREAWAEAMNEAVLTILRLPE